jgi:hypothetical protein
MPVIQEKIDAVFLWLDWVIDRAGAGHRQFGYAQLISTWRSRVRTYLSGHLDRRFLCEPGEPFPRFGGQTSFHENALKDAAPVAHHDKCNLS